MRYLTIILSLLLVGCISSVPQVKRIPPRTEKVTHFCLRGKVKFKKKMETIELCTETLALCNRAVSLAKKYGSIGDLQQVDKCRIERRY